MDGKIPRRMMRFYRKKPTEVEVREKSSEIAISKVDSFREHHNRYPNRSELDEISQSVFEQLRRELEHQDTEIDDIYLGTEKGAKGTAGEKSVLERRKEMRAAAERKGKGTGKGSEAVAKQADAKKSSAGAASGPKFSRSEMRKLAKKNGQDEKGADGAGKSPLASGGISEDGQTPKIGQEAGEGEAGPGPDAGEVGDEQVSLEELEQLEAAANREGVKKLAEIDELAKLEDELGGGAEEGEGEFDLVEKEFDSAATSCPKCQSKAEEIIYCPNCGDAFCDHCAKKVEVLSDAVKYTCAKCGAEFRKRKPTR